jgi:flagellar basal-body rod protein FlgF
LSQLAVTLALIRVLLLWAWLSQPPSSKKDPDGEIRYADGSPIVANQQAKVVSKHLEMSNVNLMEELVTSIEQQRIFEINLKLVKTAEDIDRSGTSLMKMPT